MSAAPLLADAPEVLRKAVVRIVVCLVDRPLQRRALLEMQLDSALEPNRARKICAFRQHDASAARKLSGVDRPLYRRGVFRRAVALCAEIAHVEIRRARRRGKKKENPGLYHCKSFTICIRSTPVWPISLRTVPRRRQDRRKTACLSPPFSPRAATRPGAEDRR